MNVTKLSVNSRHFRKVFKYVEQEYRQASSNAVTPNENVWIYNYCRDCVYILEYKHRLIGYFAVCRCDYISTAGSLLRLLVSWIMSYIMRRVFIYNVFILPQYRKRGLGKMMMSKAIKMCGSTYYARRVQLHTQNVETNNFYKKCGFDCIGKGEGVWFHERTL